MEKEEIFTMEEVEQAARDYMQMTDSFWRGFIERLRLNKEEKELGLSPIKKETQPITY